MVHQDHIQIASSKCLHHDLDEQTLRKAKGGLFQNSGRETNAKGLQTEKKKIRKSLR